MDCYVYVHRKKTDGRIFYVGKGRNKRAWKKTQRSDWWKRIEAKHGRTVEIVLRGMTDDQAFQLEKELIDWLGIENLCNLRDGGDGGYAMKPETKAKMSAMHKGRVVSAETREKMRISSTGRKHSEETKAKLREHRLNQVMPPVSEETRRKLSILHTGKYVSPETGRKISEAKKGKKLGPMSEERKEAMRISMTGKKVSEEAKAKLRAKALGRKHTAEAKAKLQESNARLNKERRKPIQCSNGMVFSFSGEAQNWLRENGFPTAQKTNIVSCCTGRLKSAYGFQWSFATLDQTHVFDKE